jgi:hypothetical protein
MKITVATTDTACHVTWGPEGPEVSKSEGDDGELTRQVKVFLQDDFDFPVGDVPDPGCTADYQLDYRTVASEFEMCSVMQKFPLLTGIPANVYTHE